MNHVLIGYAEKKGEKKLTIEVNPEAMKKVPDRFHVFAAWVPTPAEKYRLRQAKQLLKKYKKRKKEEGKNS